MFKSELLVGGGDTHTHKQTDRHINTVTRPGRVKWKQHHNIFIFFCMLKSKKENLFSFVALWRQFRTFGGKVLIPRKKILLSGVLPTSHWFILIHNPKILSLSKIMQAENLSACCNFTNRQNPPDDTVLISLRFRMFSTCL